MSIMKRAGGSAVVTPRQDIVAPVADDLRQELRSLLQDGVTHIDIDMENVDLVDSIGIGLLIATHNSLAEGKGALRLTNVNQDIASLLGKMRLDKHFHVRTA